MLWSRVTCGIIITVINFSKALMHVSVFDACVMWSTTSADPAVLITLFCWEHYDSLCFPDTPSTETSDTAIYNEYLLSCWVTMKHLHLKVSFLTNLKRGRKKFESLQAKHLSCTCSFHKTSLPNKPGLFQLVWLIMNQINWQEVRLSEINLACFSVPWSRISFYPGNFQFSLHQSRVLGTMKVAWLLAVFIAIVTYTLRLIQ